MEFLLPWQLIRVDGHSMTPTLSDGDRLLVRHGAPVRVGSVVLARFRSRPDLLVVKRVEQAAGDGWALASDNRAAGTDSRALGTADVLAVAVLHLPRHAGRRNLVQRGRRVRWPSSWLPRRLAIHPPWDL
jgi:nickel-type superoxide dismutase maturation protease